MTIDQVISLLRPEILTLQSYDNLRGETRANAVILDSNENILSPTQTLTQQERYRYPQIRPQQLIERLSELYKVRPEQVMLGRGSDDLIDVLIRAFCRSKTDSILQTTPCFSMYGISAHIQGAEVKSIPLSQKNNFRYEIDKVISALSDEIKLVFLASPQSPTGNLLDRSDLEKLLKFAKNQLVIIDEAYIEFASSGSSSSFPTDSASELLDTYPNLAIMRTLSKAYGLANLRCGALLAHAQLIKRLRPVLTPYALSGIVVDAAYDALRSENVAKLKVVNRSQLARKEKLLSSLRATSFVAALYPGEANFVLCRVNDAAALVSFLEKQNIYIRSYGSHSVLADYIRISVGSDKEIESLLQAFKEFELC